MNQTLRVRLSVMMFLEYLLWGAWYVTMGTYLSQTLKFSDPQIGLAYGATAIAAMISPFFIGYFADRFFATERILGVLHLVGAVVMWRLSALTDFGSFYPMLILYNLLFMPTIALTNSLSFHHISDPAKDFPGIRVAGTIGWIVMGLGLGIIGKAFFGGSIEGSHQQFVLCAIASLVMGVYCFSLPHTPPQRKDGNVTVRDILGLDALALFRDRNFSVLVLASFLVCIPLFFYYSYANAFLNELKVENAAGKMTYGQMSEIIFMLLMPLFFRRLGVKWMILVGIGAWVLRYVLFALGAPEVTMWMLLTGIILHGICYDFFFVTGQIYVDNKAPVQLRSATQGLITFATYGIGNFIGTAFAGQVAGHYKTGDGAHDWFSVWLVPASLAAAVWLLFWWMFKDDKK